METTSKAAIVTGGSRGIGRSIALRLAADGYAVAVNDAGSAPDAQKTVAEIIANGGKAIVVQGNLAIAQDVARLLDETEKAFGGVDVPVNHGGIMNLAPLASSSDELFDEQVAVNLKGTFNGLREAMRRIREGGRTINLSSSVVALRFEQ